MESESGDVIADSANETHWGWFTVVLVVVWATVLWTVGQWQLTDAGIVAMGFGVLLGMATAAWLWVLDERGVV